MATRRARARKEQPRRPFLQLAPQRWEEIIALGILVLAALTALGAFNLSGGLLLTTWVQFLQKFLGWGVYIAPLILAGLGIWLLFDSLDKRIDIGWEPPIGLALAYLTLLAILHWVSAWSRPGREPGPFQGGGLIGWSILVAFIQAVGAIGSAFAFFAIACVAVVLIFNVSPSEQLRRVFGITRLLPRAPGRFQPSFRLPTWHWPAWRRPRAHTRSISTTDSEDNWQSPEIDEIAEEPIQVEAEDTFPPTPETIAGEPVGVPSPAVPAPPPIPLALREWHLPNFADMLEDSPEQEISQQEIRKKVRVIEETLAHFGVPAKVIEVNQGPTITQFGVEPGFLEQRAADGQIHRVKVKVSRISALQHDMELALSAAPIRIEAPVPGRPIVGIEVPNSQVGMVSLRGLVESQAFEKIKSKLKIALGQDVAGQPICADLATMPHLLIAGATGSGKSVCVNSIIAALLCTATPAEVQFVMIDPKRVELINYNGIPHLKGPVVVEVQGAVAALADAVAEMDERFRLFAQESAKNIETYNRMMEDQPEKRLPFLVVIVDELADLMMVAANEVEHAITRLAQMARATGIHLILATQRPSVDVVTGLIKANFPARISFSVTSQIDSRVVLDTPGAEKLLGRGDMLYMASDSSKLLRLQGCYVSDRELDKLTAHWKEQAPPAEVQAASSEPSRTPVSAPPIFGMPPKAPSDDELIDQAIEIIRQNNKASVSLLQRKLRIGYSRAARLIELLEERGIVGPDAGPTKGRTIIEATPARVKQARVAKPAHAKTSEDDEFVDWTEKDWQDLDKD